MARLLPYLSVHPVLPAPGAELVELHTVRVATAILGRRISALPALAARQVDDYPVFLLRHGKTSS